MSSNPMKLYARSLPSGLFSVVSIATIGFLFLFANHFLFAQPPVQPPVNGAGTRANASSATANTPSLNGVPATLTASSRRPLSAAQQEIAGGITRDLAQLTRFPSRAPGTPGNAQAADYVQKRFQEIGLQGVRADRYQVTVPVTQGQGTLTLNGRALPIYPVYPNGVAPSTTPRDGISGRIIYGGAGAPANFNGQQVADAIVALDFNSGMNWITAADLGARAVIFLERPAIGNQTPTTRGEAERKFGTLPAEMPRFYARRAEADAILSALGVSGTGASANGAAGSVSAASSQSEAQAKLVCRVKWERADVRNIIGIIPGTDPELKKQTVVINGYYDSMAVVPDLAPGAEAAGNCAALLSLAEYFKNRPAKYSLMFVANGAHHVALAGARNFAAQHLFDVKGTADDKAKERIKSFRAFVGLDLTSRTDTVGIFAKSSFYNQMTVGSENILLKQYFTFAKTMYEDYAAPEAKRRGLKIEDFFVDGIRGLEGRSWRSYLPSLVALDSEVATMAQKAGLSFATANDARMLQDTPFDLPRYVSVPNLARQVDTIRYMLTRSLQSGQDAKKNDFQTLPDDSSLSATFGYGVGRAIYRNTDKITSFLPSDPLPDEQLDPKAFAGHQTLGVILDRTKDYKTYSGVRGALIERAQYSKPTAKNALPTAQFLFLGPRVGDPKGGGTPDNEIEAYTVDADGRVVFAPDLGAAVTNFSPKFNKAGTIGFKDEKIGEYNVNATTMCFPARGVALYDTLDQRYFQVLKEMTVLDGQTDANPVEYGYLRPLAPGSLGEIEPVAIVFGKPGERFKLIMQQGLIGKRLLLLDTEYEKFNAESKQAVLDSATGKPVLAIDPEGVGVAVPQTNDPGHASVRHMSYLVARDMWTLDQQRIHLLKKFGINNERVDQLHGAVGCPIDKDAKTIGQTIAYDCPTEAVAKPTGGALLAAQTALSDRQYDTFYREARRAFGIESRAYPDVEATAQDVLKGIVFYLALLLPFSFFLERLIFGFPDIRKQIAYAFVMFLAVFWGISRVHPAFELALTPFIILLAFIILALTVVVTTFLSSKFEAEIKRLKQGVHFADVGRLSAISAALGLGIANMRRRPTRTALTCVTLVLLTFTVLSFTSVTASISNFARPYGEHPPTYAGMMIRQPDWSPLQEAAVTSMRNEFTQRFGQIALRSWLLSRDQGEQLYLRVNNAENPNKYFYAPALLGMTPEEKAIGSPVPNTVLPGGRWFEPGDRDVCLLPRTMLVPGDVAKGTAAAKDDAGATGDTSAEQDPLPLGLTVDDAVGKYIQVAGQTLRVIGVYDDQKLTNRTGEGGQTAIAGLRDLDDEQFTPVDYQNEQNKQTNTSVGLAGQKGEEAQVQRYQHMDANALVLLPYETTLAMGGTTRSIAAGFNTTGTRTAAADPAIAVAASQAVTSGEEGLQDLMKRAALGIFGATPGTDGKLQTRLYSSVESTSYEGFAALVIPVLIAALIIANTMLGSVFERTREIGIYSSVGLAPVHVAALFIAEAIVYAVLGSISGYLIAQTVAKIVTANNLLPGITLNYSSSSAVLATLIVMATVLLSTLYPAWQASRMSQPDIDRKWQMSSPIGDVWRFQFPFTVSGQQPLGVAQFLADFFETHTDTSIGSFYTDRVNFAAMPLRDAATILNDVPEGLMNGSNGSAASTRNGSLNGHAKNGHATNGTAATVALDSSSPSASSQRPDAHSTGLPTPAVGADGKSVVSAAPTVSRIDVAKIAADENTEVYHLAMRVWLAPFDMGVSQDVDIFLMPSDEPGLYELQLKLVRQSGEIAAWKRVNRGFMSDLRRQLLLWRTIKPVGQQEYILRGRAHVTGQRVPVEEPGAVVGASAA